MYQNLFDDDKTGYGIPQITISENIFRGLGLILT